MTRQKPPYTLPPQSKVTSTNAPHPHPHPNPFEMFLALAFLILRKWRSQIVSTCILSNELFLVNIWSRAPPHLPLQRKVTSTDLPERRYVLSTNLHVCISCTSQEVWTTNQWKKKLHLRINTMVIILNLRRRARETKTQIGPQLCGEILRSNLNVYLAAASTLNYSAH